MLEPTGVAERWLPVPVFADLYEVSDLGRVRSLDRWIQRKTGGKPYLKKGRMLSLGLSSNGYYTVYLCRNGKGSSIPVHSLVLLAFIGPPPPGKECLHGSNGKLDNRLVHLRYGTRTENNLDMQQHGTDYHRNLTHCKYGHLLKLPNLVASIWAKGYRDCLACARARASKQYAQQKNRPYDFRSKADEYYALIINTAA